MKDKNDIIRRQLKSNHVIYSALFYTLILCEVIAIGLLSWLLYRRDFYKAIVWTGAILYLWQTAMNSRTYLLDNKEAMEEFESNGTSDNYSPNAEEGINRLILEEKTLKQLLWTYGILDACMIGLTLFFLVLTISSPEGVLFFGLIIMLALALFFTYMEIGYFKDYKMMHHH